MSTSELDGWDLVPRRSRRPRRRWVLAAVGVLALGLVVWGLAGTWYDGPLDWQHAGRSTACVPDPLRAPGDVTMTLGIGDLEGRRLLGVRLLGERGVHLVEADVADVPAVDGASALSPLQAGWPGLAGGSISPTSLVPAAGASMSGAASHALVLRLHVDDPSTESGFDDVGIDYRSGLIRQERRLLYSLRLVPDAACR